MLFHFHLPLFNALVRALPSLLEQKEILFVRFCRFFFVRFGVIKKCARSKLLLGEPKKKIENFFL